MATSSTPITPRLMRFPSVLGDRLVFTYAGDLWVSSINGGPSRRLTSGNGLEQFARISPDGKLVAFSGMYDGNTDVYVIPIEGGEPKRLTFDPEPDTVVNWTPDGKIAYTTNAGNFINRQQRLVYVSPDGGLPTATPLSEAVNASFFPDGKRIAYNRMNSYAFNWRRYRGGTHGRVSIYDFSTNQYSELPTGREQNYHPMVVGDSIYYISDRSLGTLNLYRYDTRSRRATQLTQFNDSDIRYPATDGKTIVWERDGYLERFDLAKNEVTPLRPEIRSENLWSRPTFRNVGAAIANYSLSPSGVRLAVEARGELFSVAARQGDTRNLSNTSGTRERFPEWSPDGQTIAYVSDATGNFEVYTRPANGQGEPVQITNEKLPIIGIDWSPDGKRILVTASQSKLYLVDVAAKTTKLLFDGGFGISGVDWSPDNKWVVVCSTGRNQFSRVQLVSLADGKVTQITDGRYNDASAVFDRTGKYLYIRSSRTFNPSFGEIGEFSLKVQNTERLYVLPLAADTPNPLIAPSDEEPVTTPPSAQPTPPQAGTTAAPAAAASAAGQAGGPSGVPTAPPSRDIKIDLEGINDRLIPLPLPAGNYFGLAGMNNGVLYVSNGALSLFSLTTRESTPILPQLIGGYSLNASRTKIAHGFGGNIFVVDLRPGNPPGAGRVDVSDVGFLWNPRDEWRQIFWEAWRFNRDNFYDTNMRGVNWPGVGRKYEAYLDSVNHRSDLSYVLGLMVGELGTGHSYVQGGEIFGVNPPTPVSIGHLGVDYEVSGENIRFRRILRGESFDESRRGPLGEPGINVKEGDYLLAIDGQPVNANVHPHSLLLNKAGKFVTLTVNSSPTRTGARTVRVRTLPSETNLRYITFVEDNRRRVERLSGGRIGYMHIPNTATEGAIELIRGFWSQSDKDAVLVDERWNGGGFIQPWFVETLARRKMAGIQLRNLQWEGDQAAIEGPKALLINGYAGSGGDFFPWMFRQRKLGALIGTRTWGGLVGISGGAPLVDGGSVTAPGFSLFDFETQQIIAENTGVDPDIEVDARPDLIAKGQDPQLERGVAHLLEQLKSYQPRNPLRGVPPVEPKGRVGIGGDR